MSHDVPPGQHAWLVLRPPLPTTLGPRAPPELHAGPLLQARRPRSSDVPPGQHAEPTRSLPLASSHLDEALYSLGHWTGPPVAPLQPGHDVRPLLLASPGLDEAPHSLGHWTGPPVAPLKPERGVSAVAYHVARQNDASGDAWLVHALS